MRVKRKIDCHRSISSSCGLLHPWLWPLYTQSNVCERWWGKSHWEVLAPFAKAVIMRGCVGQGQPTAGAIRQDHHNKAAFCFPLQFSHMDNRVQKMWCVCVPQENARGIINVSTAMAEGQKKKQKKKNSDETIIFGLRLKENSSPLHFFPPHFFIESFIREKKKIIKSNSIHNIHRCTDSFSKITRAVCVRCDHALLGADTKKS